MDGIEKKMYNLLYKLYFKIYNKYGDNRVPIYAKMYIKFIKFYLNNIQIIIYKLPHRKIKSRKLIYDEKIIASLTTFPDRIQTVWITIESLLRQTVKPDKIILWLSKEQFKSKDDLPKRLLKLQKKGLDIKFCDELRSYKKCFYTLLEHMNDLILTFDDDMFYPYDTVELLLGLHKKHPKNVVCVSACWMNNSFNTLPSTWENANKRKIINEKYAYAYTGAGTLYPPNVLSSKMFNKEKMFKLCPSADDLWMKVMEDLVDTKITRIDEYRPFPITIKGTQNKALYKINDYGQNDVQWKNLMREYYAIEIN